MPLILGRASATPSTTARVISSTKWELNIARKYHVASWAMVPRRVGLLIFDVPDFATKKLINENARKSGVYISPQGSVEMSTIRYKFRVIS